MQPRYTAIEPSDKRRSDHVGTPVAVEVVASERDLKMTGSPMPGATGVTSPLPA